MSNRPMRTLQDVVRAGLSLQMTCQGCGRVAVYAAIGFMAYVRGNPAALALSTLEKRLRCDGDSPGSANGCGHRGARIVAIEWPPPGLEPRRPVPKVDER